MAENKQKSEKGYNFIGKTIVFCPKCKSTDVIKKLAPMAIPNFGALAQMNLCNDCGFQDKIFPEIDEGDKDILGKIQKIFKKKKSNKK